MSIGSQSPKELSRTVVNSIVAVVTNLWCLFIYNSRGACHTVYAGLSHPFLGMGPGPLELGKIGSF